MFTVALLDPSAQSAIRPPVPCKTRLAAWFDKYLGAVK